MADQKWHADCILSRLAGYWEKFSISNNRARMNLSGYGKAYGKATAQS